jgi:hypothetical protein
LHCITTYWNIVKYFLNILKKGDFPGGVFKQKMLSRVRRKRLNIPPGCVAAGQKIV